MDKAHPALKYLLGFIGLLGVLSGFFFKNLSPILSLSLAGPQQGRLWQLATYPLSLGSPLDWWNLSVLGFELVLLWLYSAPLIQQKGLKSYFMLLTSGVLTGAIGGLLGMLILPDVLSGPTPILFTILTAWAFFYPSQSIRWFNSLLNTKTLLLVFLGIDILVHLSQEHWTRAFSSSAGFITGYLYYKLPTCSSFFLRKLKPQTTSQPKIYDIKSGKPVLDDEQFMDAMLARISRHGESSLHPEEKERMLKISQKKIKKPRS